MGISREPAKVRGRSTGPAELRRRGQGCKDGAGAAKGPAEQHSAGDARSRRSLTLIWQQGEELCQQPGSSEELGPALAPSEPYLAGGGGGAAG